jgi:hypothetical protein
MTAFQQIRHQRREELQARRVKMLSTRIDERNGYCAPISRYPTPVSVTIWTG